MAQKVGHLISNLHTNSTSPQENTDQVAPEDARMTTTLKTTWLAHFALLALACTQVDRQLLLFARVEDRRIQHLLLMADEVASDTEMPLEQELLRRQTQSAQENLARKIHDASQWINSSTCAFSIQSLRAALFEAQEQAEHLSDARAASRLDATVE